MVLPQTNTRRYRENVAARAAVAADRPAYYQWLRDKALEAEERFREVRAIRESRQRLAAEVAAEAAEEERRNAGASAAWGAAVEQEEEDEMGDEWETAEEEDLVDRDPVVEI